MTFLLTPLNWQCNISGCMCACILLFYFLILILVLALCHPQETKSVGAEVNWGVRFNDIVDVGTS